MSEQAAAKPKEISCEQCRELLSDYIDRELSAEEQVAVEHHVATCFKCSTESSRLSGLKHVVQHWDGVKGSAEFRKSTIEKMITESQMMPSKPFTDAADSVRKSGDDDSQKGLPLGWVIAIAAVLAVIAFVVVKMMRE